MNYPSTFPNLFSDRLQLRQLSFSDKKDILRLRSNTEINHFITRDTPKNLNETEGFIQTCLDEFEKENRIFWAIQKKESNEIIGTIVYHNINVVHNYAEIGYELHPDAQNKGFMSEAITSVLAYGKSILKLNTIEAFTHQNNIPSISLLKKHHFILQKDKKDIIIKDNCIFRLDINHK